MSVYGNEHSRIPSLLLRQQMPVSTLSVDDVSGGFSGRLTLCFVAVVFLIALKRFVFPVQAGSVSELSGPPRHSWLTGNLTQMFNSLGLSYQEELLEKYGRVSSVNGLFGEKQLFVADTQACATVLKKPDLFTNIKPFVSVAKLVLGHNSMSAATGETHRRLRKAFNPVFAPRYMYNLANTFYSTTDKLRERLTSSISGHPQQEIEFDLLDWTSRTSLELVGLGVLGYQFNALEHTQDSYVKATKLVMLAISKMAFITPVLHILMCLGTPKSRRFLVSIIPSTIVQQLKSSLEVTYATAWKIYNAKSLGQFEDNTCNDVLSLIVKSNLQNSNLTESEIVDQVNTLTFAAVETTSSSVVRVLQLLSERPKIQERLREELIEADLSGDFPLARLEELPFLNAVCQEMLRLHPPIPWLARIAQSDTVVPLAFPVSSTRSRVQLDQLTVRKGETIYISIHGVNRDPAIWGADANEFNPGRWLDPVTGKSIIREEALKAKVPGLWSSILSFSAGPKGCIGFRFGVIGMKSMLAVLVRSFEFKPAPGKEIEWYLSTTLDPGVKGEKESSLPLRVSLVNSKDRNLVSARWH